MCVCAADLSFPLASMLLCGFSEPAKLRKASSIVTEVTQTSWPNQHFCLQESDGVGPPVIRSKPLKA